MSTETIKYDIYLAYLTKISKKNYTKCINMIF